LVAVHRVLTALDGAGGRTPCDGGIRGALRPIVVQRVVVEHSVSAVWSGVEYDFIKDTKHKAET
jgi:hypothetical protein